jgi:hypothetical protein
MLTLNPISLVLRLNTFCSASNDKSYGTRVWNARLASQSADTDILEEIIPHDRKEAALALFSQNDYKIDGVST